MKYVITIFLAVIAIAALANLGNGITDKIYTFEEFDSLCSVDSIPRALSTWESSDYYSENDDKVKTRYYISKGDSVGYVVESLDDGFFKVHINRIP